MATRINTKFVITLTAIIVLIVLCILLAFTFVTKNAEDHVRLAEKAMERAEVALAAGEIKEHNTERKRAANHYGSANAKDAGNVSYLYDFIDAHELVVCLNLTAAGNQLDSILAGAAKIHDTPLAADEDRELIYEILHERARMQLSSGRQHPIGAMLGYTTKRLDVAPEDPVATKYRAISLSHMAEGKTDEAEVLLDIQFLNETAATNPENPWLQSALARYHLGNARRLYRTAGSKITAEVNANFELAFKHTGQALALAADNMPAFVEAAGLAVDLRSGDEKVIEQINQLKQAVGKQLSVKLQDKANRDALVVEEIERSVTVLKQFRPDAENPETSIDGRAAAMALAQALVKDRPEEPGAFQVLGNLQRESNQFEQAEKTIEDGLAIKRQTGAATFIRDNRARLAMRGLLADIKCTLALRAGDNAKRDALLDQANKIIDEMAKADTLQSQVQWRDARVSFLRGRVMLALNKPRQAVSLLEAANQAYANKDAQTLRLLAQTHSRLGNDKLVAGFYETIIQNNLRPTAEDLLNLINLYTNPGESQQLDRAQAQLDYYRKLVPGDIRAIRLQARLWTQQEKYDEAVALLEANLEKNPDLMDLIVAIRAEAGETGGAIDLLRKRIADRPEGQDMNLQAVTRLLNLLPDAEQKKAELDRLAADGLDPKITSVLRNVLTSGSPTLEDELALIEIQGGSAADVAMRKFLLYQRRGDIDKAKPFLDKASELAPKRGDVIEWRFKLALNEKEWAKAEQAIGDMLELSPSERPEIAVADARFMRAQVLAIKASAMEVGEARTKQIREAVVAYNKALDEYSHYVDGWVQLGRLHYVQGNFFAAQGSLLEALNRQSKNLEALELMALSEQSSGDQINALERYEQILTIRPGHPTALDRFTNLAQQMGLGERAIALREQIQERLPNNYNNRRVLALLYAQNDSHTKAKQTIQGVIDAEGGSRQNLAIMIQVLGANEQHDQAIKATEDYLAGLGKKAEWRDYLLLAQAFELAEKPEQADDAFDKAIAMEQADGTFSSSLSKAQTLLSRGKTPEAAALFENLIKAYPENDALKRQAAELYLRLGNFEKAESIAKSMPESADRARLLIQSASLQENKLGLAIKRAQQATSAYPSDFTLRLNLLELLRTQEDRKAQDQRDYNKLLAMAKSLAKEHPDRIEAKVSLADIYLRMDRRPQATAILEDALEFAPRHLATNERLSGIKLMEARELATVNPQASQEKAREALAIISILLDSRPGAPTLLRSAGQAAELSGVTAQAVDYYKQTFEATNAVSDLAAYASALLTAGRGAEARAALEGDNATLVSGSVFMRALRGRAISAAGQPDAAANLFKSLLGQSKEPSEQAMIAQQVLRAFASEPERLISLIDSSLGNNVPVQIDLSIASLLMGQRSYDQVIERLKKYVAKPADDFTAQFTILTQIALAYQESGKLEDAKAAYERAYEKMNEKRELVPERQQVQMLNNMAYLLADQLQGYEKDAVRYAKQALALMSDNVSPEEYALIEDTLGWAYFKAGQTEAAIRVLKSSVDKYPLVANRLHLGQAYLDAGDKERAYLVLSAAVDQAKAEGDEKMIAETQKWFKQAS